MEAVTFCPAHITGFFKAYLDDNVQKVSSLGSTGAGFSIKKGVTTSVKINQRGIQESNYKITIHGYIPDQTNVSEFVLKEFLKLGDFSEKFFDITHEILVPIGYGLGSSSATALSLAFALDKALNTKLEKTQIGQIAHNAEINCKTGLGDVLASFHGGFEIRTKAGAPGVGQVKKLEAGKLSILMICFSPISTNKFIKENLSQINGVGEKMVNRLLESKDYKQFQDMSLEFAKYVGIMTPRLSKVIQELSEHKIKCGVAIFGETVFSMVQENELQMVYNILKKYTDGIIIQSEIDNYGIRVL